MIGFNTHLITSSTTTRSTVTIIVMVASVTKLTATRHTNTMASLHSCKSDRISPYILFTSEVMLLWITAVSAPR